MHAHHGVEEAESDCRAPADNEVDIIKMTSAQHVSITRQGSVSDTDVARPGMVLTVRYADTGSTETFILGGYGAGDADNRIYPLRSPLGRAIAGARPGEHRTLRLPDGSPIALTLLSVRPARGVCLPRSPRDDQKEMRNHDHN